MDNYPVDSNALRAQGTQGVMSAVGGIALLGVNALIHIPVVGWILGGALVLVGISGIFSRSKTEKTSRSIMIAAGAAGLAAILLPKLAGFLLGLGGIALLGFGTFNIYKFVKGLRSRA